MTSNAARSIIWRGRASAPGYPFAAVRNERMRSLASSASLVHVVRRQGTPSISAHCILRVGAGAKERRAVWLIALFASAAAAKECRAKPASSSAHWHSIFLSSARCMKCYRHLILKSSLQGKDKGCLLCGWQEEGRVGGAKWQATRSREKRIGLSPSGGQGETGRGQGAGWRLPFLSFST